MANNNSLLARYSLGVQSAKGTQATAFITGLKTQSSMPPPTFDEAGANRSEHPGTVSRNTGRRSYKDLTGYIASFSSQGILYPRLFPVQLIGAGFTCTTSDETTHYEHTFHLSLADALEWISVIHQATDQNWQRVIRDARITQLQVQASTDELTVSDQGQGLHMGAPAGGPTFQSEEPTAILPSVGSMTITVNSGSITGTVRGYNFQVQQGLDTNDKALFTQQRADLPQQSIAVSGEAQDLDITRSDYQLVVNAGVNNTDPSLVTARGSISTKFQSAGNISGAAAPYSVEFKILAAEFSMGEFQASGSDPMRYALAYEMVDAPGGPAQPVEVIVVNDVAAY